MAEVNANLALAIKPPVLEPLDLGKQVMTLAQFNRLGVLTRAAAQQAQREQQLFDQDAVASQTLASLKDGTFVPPGRRPGSAGAPQMLASLTDGTFVPPDRGAAPAPTGAPQPGTRSSTEPAVTGPTGDYAQDLGPGAPAGPAAAPRRQRSILDPDVQAELYRLAPNVASSRIKDALERHTESLKAQHATFESIARGLVHVTDESSYQAFLLTASTLLPPEMVSQFPQSYPGPEGVAKIVQNAKSVTDTFKERIDAGNLAVAQKGAETATAAEERANRSQTFLDTPEGGKIAVPTYSPQGGGATPSGETIPGTGTRWAPGEIAAYEHHRQAEPTHEALLTLEQKALGKNVLQSGTGLVQQRLMQVPFGKNFSTDEAQQLHTLRLKFLQQVNEGVLPEGQKRTDLEDLYFVREGETNAAVVAQKAQNRVDALRLLQSRTNRPVGAIPPGQKPLQGRPGEDRTIQGAAGPPAAGLTRWNITLDGQVLSADTRTKEEAEAFFRRTRPGRTFTVTSDTGTGAAPAARITPDDISKAQGFAHAKGKTWTADQARNAIESYRQRGLPLPWETR